MAKLSICSHVGQAKLQLCDLTPFGGLITAAWFQGQLYTL